jgi:LPS sulfotransferase NodH
LHSPLDRLRSAHPEAEWTRFVRFPSSAHNEHLERIEKHFGPIVRAPGDYPAGVSPVFLCFVNRSGSNYLAEMLASGGKYNRASEILNWPAILQISQRAGFTRFQDFFAELMVRQQQSGVFFLKAALQHLEILTRAGAFDQLADRSRFILIERSDKLAQAISFALALETGAFSSDAHPMVQPHEAEYSRKTIEKFVNTIAHAYRQFALFFARNGIVPVHVTYERLVARPKSEVLRLARELGLKNFSVDLRNVRLERQHGPANEEWRRRYLLERQ